jgi:hypothetical protein
MFKNISLINWRLWLEENWKATLVGFGAIFFLLVAVFFLTGKLTKTTEIKYPHEDQKYQKLLDSGEIQKALRWFESGLKRIKESSPEYARFSQNTFTIAQKDFVKALNEAKDLKKELKEFSLLSYFNLLRIALLEMQLNNQQAESAAWKELLSAAEKNPHTWMQFQACLQQGDLSLMEFIQSRLNF